MIFIISGSRKGIGRELVEHYLSSGHTVIGCSRGLTELAHPNYTHFELDVSDEPAVASMVKKTARAHGRIDVLINNAGIATMNPVALTPLTTAKSIFNTNFHGTFLLSREVAKVMLKQERGRIINLSTVAHPLKLEGEALYAASKAAVESFTQVQARELGPTGITVNAIGPTPVLTDLVKGVPKEKMDSLLQRQAIVRFGSIEDITNVIDFFIRPTSDFITGQVLYLGGIS